MALDLADRGELAKILVKRDGHLILLQTNNANERIFNSFIRVTATLYYGPGASKPRSAEDSLEQIRIECKSFEKPRHVSERLLDVARKLSALHGNVFLGPVTNILHARILAVALMSARGVNNAERERLLEQWERVSFRIFGLYGKDARTKVGEYVRLAAKIVSEDIETRTYNQIMAKMRYLGTEFPIANAVEEGLSNRNCYEEAPDMCRYVLWQYEEHLAKSLGGGATIDDHERAKIWKRRAIDSIEHVFPQAGYGVPQWNGKMRRSGAPEENVYSHVGRIGNLLLLPISLNQQAKTKPFSEKKDIYRKHHLRMIEEVCAESDWTLAQIDAREDRILTWAKVQWNDL